MKNIDMIAKYIRKDTIKQIAIQGGNLATNLASAEILTAIYQTAAHNKIIVTKELTPAWRATLVQHGIYAKKHIHTQKLPTGTEHPIGESTGTAISQIYLD